MIVPRRFLTRQAPVMFTAIFLALLFIPLFPAQAQMWYCVCAKSNCATEITNNQVRASEPFGAADESSADSICQSTKCPKYPTLTKYCEVKPFTPPVEVTPPEEYLKPPPATGKYVPEKKEGGEVVKLVNPLSETSVPKLVSRIINIALSLVGSLALLMFVYGGYTWLTSGGSADRIKQGRDIMVWATIGIILVFASYALVRFVLSAFSKNLG